MSTPDDFERLIEMAQKEEHPDGYVLVYRVDGPGLSKHFLDESPAREAWDSLANIVGQRDLEIGWMDPKPAPRKFRKRSDSLMHGNEEIEITCDSDIVRVRHLHNGKPYISDSVLAITEPDLLRSLMDVLDGFVDVLEHNRALAALSPLEQMLADRYPE